MEQNQDSSLFGLNIDPTGKNHLSEAARWAKFIAVVGFIMCGLIVLMGIFAGSVFTSLSSSRYSEFDTDARVTQGMGIVTTIMCILVALLYFFPFLFLSQFASKMKAAILSNDQNTLNGSFQSLKKTFRYVGILTIIVLAIYIIIILAALAGNGLGR